MAYKPKTLPFCIDIPDLCRLVGACRCQQFPVAGKRNTSNFVLMPPQHTTGFARHIPDSDRVIAAKTTARRQFSTFRRKHEGFYMACVPSKNGRFDTALYVPKLDRLFAAHSDRLAVR